MGFRRQITNFRISSKVVRNRQNIFDLRNPEEVISDNYMFRHRGRTFQKCDFEPDAWQALLYRTPAYKVIKVLKEIGD